MNAASTGSAATAVPISRDWASRTSTEAAMAPRGVRLGLAQSAHGPPGT
jgi:hypothetical protein